MATSSNMSWSTQDSTSRPEITPTPQSDFSLQLAQFLEQLGQTQMAWAMQEYARVGRVTDAQIENFVKLAQQGSDMAGQAIDRYNNQYAPLEDQYAREAQSYASDARMSREMGAAISRSRQASDAAKRNAENELESFGIDPSSGRYQDLVRASATDAAAAAAAAGEQARVATEAEGDRRKMNAIAIGQRLPPQALNALNSAYQGVQGAARTAIDTANTGVNLTTSPTKFLDPAMRPLQPLQGQNSQSVGRGGSQGGSSSGGGGGGGGRTSDPFNSDRFGRGSSAPPMQGGAYRPGGSGGGQTANPSYMRNPHAAIQRVPGGGAPLQQDLGGFDPWDPYATMDPVTRAYGDVMQDNGWDPAANQWDPNAGFGGSTQDMWGNDPVWTGGFGNTQGNGGDWGYDPSATYQGWDSQGWNASGQQTGSWDNSAIGMETPAANWGDTPQADPWAGDSYSDWGGQQTQQQDWGAPSYGDNSGWDTSGWDTGGGSSDYGSWGSDSVSMSTPDANWGSGSWDSGGDSGGYEGGYDDWYAKGGPVGERRPLPRGNPGQRPGGGFVPPSMSPSRGQRTDDIPAVIPQTGGQARINAGEFVLPEDVVKWKGQEFFQKMIAQSRKARMGAPAKPTSKPSGGFNG